MMSSKCSRKPDRHSHLYKSFHFRTVTGKLGLPVLPAKTNSHHNGPNCVKGENFGKIYKEFKKLTYMKRDRAPNLRPYSICLTSRLASQNPEDRGALKMDQGPHFRSLNLNLTQEKQKIRTNKLTGRENFLGSFKKCPLVINVNCVKRAVNLTI